ncbi:hypothetical protein RhiirA5_396725 [Rhizophagus irregularis]|uniref:Uncharacterized protein n=1 Tax=Rhizophagus irregularis TaxID=588596 RepID=A0A2N0Q0Y8_9GLOM|nr:hypothetical protein RhiirA5_396725 [Rhizophagus irregularis]
MQSLHNKVEYYLAYEFDKVTYMLTYIHWTADVREDSAEKIGVEKYSHIWDLRCIAHTINLMADDLVKLDNIKDLILDRGKITRFFNNSHQASAILFQALGVNDDGFRNAAIAATTLWQNLGYPEILKNNAENFSVNLGGLIKN